jgi:hypothetical protein
MNAQPTAENGRAEPSDEIIQAEQIEASDCQIGTLKTQQALVNSSVVGTMVANEAVVHKTFVGILAAERVQGEVTVLISPKGAAILGGLAIGAVLLTRWMRRD